MVRKWLKRYREKALKDLSRRPKGSPFKTSSYIIEEKVLKIRKERDYRVWADFEK